jgi:hypothetical protein
LDWEQANPVAAISSLSPHTATAAAAAAGKEASGSGGSSGGGCSGGGGGAVAAATASTGKESSHVVAAKGAMLLSGRGSQFGLRDDHVLVHCTAAAFREATYMIEHLRMAKLRALAAAVEAATTLVKAKAAAVLAATNGVDESSPPPLEAAIAADADARTDANANAETTTGGCADGDADGGSPANGEGDATCAELIGGSSPPSPLGETLAARATLVAEVKAAPREHRTSQNRLVRELAAACLELEQAEVSRKEKAAGSGKVKGKAPSRFSRKPHSSAGSSGGGMFSSESRRSAMDAGGVKIRSGGASSGCVKACKGSVAFGCTWDMGEANASEYCSVCTKKLAA